MKDESQNTLYPGPPPSPMGPWKEAGSRAQQQLGNRRHLCPLPERLLVSIYCSSEAHHVCLTEKEKYRKKKIVLSNRGCQVPRHSGTWVSRHLSVSFPPLRKMPTSQPCIDIPGKNSLIIPPEPTGNKTRGEICLLGSQGFEYHQSCGKC